MRAFTRFVLVAVSVALLAPNLSGAVELRAGVAKAPITPPLDPPLIGVMGKPLTGVIHDIYARALTLYDGKSRIVIVTYDLNCLDVATPILRQCCRDELGIDPACLILLGTHNHAAPIQIVPGNFDYGRRLAETIFGLIKQAIDAESGPAHVRFAFGNAYFLMSMGNAPADYEVQLLEVRRGSEPLAILFNHPTHPLQISETEIDPGHVGYAVDEIEQRVPGVMAMYADACGGNQFTRSGMFQTKEAVEALGRELANAVMEIAGGTMEDVTGPLNAKREVISLPFAEPLPFDAASKLALHYPSGIGLVPYPHPDRETNWVRSLMKHYTEKIPFPKRSDEYVCTDDGFLVKELPAPREFECRYEETIVATIGPMVLAAMQGEVCAPIGMRIKDAFRYERPIMVFAYMGEHNLYIPTREIVRLGYYQSQVLQIQYASPVPWAEGVEGAMVNGVKGLINSVLAEGARVGE